MDYDITENIKNPLNGIMILVYMGYFLGLIFFINYSNKEVKEIEPEKEENKYLNEYNNLELDDIKDDRLKEIENNYIEEETEKYGIIRMYYKEGFIYYTSERKNVPYVILDMVARKFVINNNCKILHVDIIDEINKAKEQSNKEPLESKKKIDDVFAKFKDYNIIKKNNINIKSKINNFKYGGKISDISTKRISIEACKLSYSEFKKNN
tara:strand:+ start:237 stop:863 length:627 start_codon:yes stop_codon:yes gene_type:complete